MNTLQEEERKKTGPLPFHPVSALLAIVMTGPGTPESIAEASLTDDDGEAGLSMALSVMALLRVIVEINRTDRSRQGLPCPDDIDADGGRGEPASCRCNPGSYLRIGAGS